MNQFLRKICYLTLIPSMGWCQSDLQQINSRLKNNFIKTEEVDQLIPALKKIPVDPNSGDQQKLLFETYLMATDRYASSNHFKQAYVLFQEYLSIKEKALAHEKAGIIKGEIESNTRKKLMTGVAIKNTGDELKILESNLKEATLRNSNFIRNMILVVILIAGIFAVLLLRISLKIKKLKDDIAGYKTDLMAMEKSALLGHLGIQVNHNRQANIQVIGKEITTVSELLKRMEPLMAKDQLPALKAIEDSYHEAERGIQQMRMREPIKPAEPVL